MRIVGVCSALLVLSPFRPVVAGDDAVPPAVQAELLAKIPEYDRNFRDVAGERVHVLLLTKKGSAESIRTANLIGAAIAKQAAIAGLPHDVTALEYSSAAALARECAKRSVSMLYVGPGFDAEVDSVCAAVEPLHVRTVTSVPDYAKRCVVVGFRLDAGRPKILVNLAHAQKSDIRYRADLLKLAEVYR